MLLQERVVKQLDKEEKMSTNNKCLPDNIIRHQFLNMFIKVIKDKLVRGNYIKLSILIYIIYINLY